MRVDGTLYYLLSDHLRSTSITTDASGSPVSETRYRAWGEVRYAADATPTDYTYTGQYSHTSDFGLMYYNARWYDPYLNRFAQADSIIPGAGNPQAWDRYAYTQNNPVRYNDPSGHWFESVLDIAFIAYDIYDISQNGLNWETGLSLAADVAGLALPVVTGGGLAVRAAMHADDVVDAARVVDKAVDTANAAEGVSDILSRGDDIIKGGKNLAEQGLSGAQNLIDDIVQKDFKNVNLTEPPRFNPDLPNDTYGQATRGLSTEIGPLAIIEGKVETLITIAHEEMHHRVWERGWKLAGQALENYVEKVAQRFARLKGY